MGENSLQGFFNWVIYYPSKYWTKFPGYIDMMIDKREALILLIIILPSFLALLAYKKIKDQKSITLLILFCLVGLLSIYPRFSFFHFQTALPFFVILYAFLIYLNRKYLVLISILFLLFSIAKIQKPVLATDWQRSPRFWSEEDFKSSKLLNSGEKSYLLGYHSGLYVLSNTLPPKPWLDNYGWYFEMPNVKNEVISKWKEDPPGQILWKQPINGNEFDLGTYQPKELVNWIKENYNYVSDDLWKKKN